MNVRTKITSDVEGLAHQVDPLSRRGFFLATSAAAAAGYTLAAGPVRADAIQTDTNGLTVGDAKVKVAGGDMPVYFARPANVPNPPVIMVKPIRTFHGPSASRNGRGTMYQATIHASPRIQRVTMTTGSQRGLPYFTAFLSFLAGGGV